MQKLQYNKDTRIIPLLRKAMRQQARQLKCEGTEEEMDLSDSVHNLVDEIVARFGYEGEICDRKVHEEVYQTVMGEKSIDSLYGYDSSYFGLREEGRKKFLTV